MNKIMNKIVNCKLNIGRNGENGEVTGVSAFFSYEDLSGKRGNYELTLEDIIQMLNGEGVYRVGNKGKTFQPNLFQNPGGDSDFGWIVSLLLNAAVYYKVITLEQYISLVRYHYDNYYLRIYQSKSKMCSDFYSRYFSRKCKTKYHTYSQMIAQYKDEIDKKGRKVSVRRGGEFCGCYYDSWYDKRRPITSRVYYDSVVPIAEKLWVCFMEESNKRFIEV